MSRLRLLADQDFDERILKGLLQREPSIDFVRSREVGLDRAPDAAVLAYAASDTRVVLSHDANTMTAAALARMSARLPMNGLIIIPQRRKIGRLIDDLLIVWGVLDSDELMNTIRYVPL